MKESERKLQLGIVNPNPKISFPPRISCQNFKTCPILVSKLRTKEYSRFQVLIWSSRGRNEIFQISETKSRRLNFKKSFIFVVAPTTNQNQGNARQPITYIHRSYHPWLNFFSLETTLHHRNQTNKHKAKCISKRKW